MTAWTIALDTYHTVTCLVEANDIVNQYMHARASRLRHDKRSFYFDPVVKVL